MGDLEARLSALFEGSRDAIGIGRDGVHVDVNAAHLRLFGCASKAQVVGTPVLDLVAPSEREAVSRRVRSRWAGGAESADYRTRGLRRDGGEFDMEVHVLAYRQGEDRYSVAFLRDVSEQARAEEALWQSRSRMERVLEGMPDGFFLLDSGWRYAYANRSAAASGGVTRDDLLGRCIWDLAPQAVGGPFHQACLRARNERVATSHFEVGWDYGSAKRWYDYSIFPVDEMVAVHFRDVTDRKAAEETLRQFQFMVDRSAEEVYLVRRDGSFVYANEAAARSLGYTVEELLSRGLAGIDPGVGPRFAQRFEELRAGPAAPFETEHLTRDGRRVTKEMRSFHLRIGEAEYVCGFGHDISARKEAGRLLERGLRLERALREVDRHVIAGDLSGALRAVCGAVVGLGHAMCWIGLAEHGGTVRPVAVSGADEGYLEHIRVRWDDGPEGGGPTGRALRTGLPQVCADIATDPAFAPWAAEAGRRGYRSSAAYPLLSAGREAIGTLNAYRSQAGAYSEQELEALQTMAQQATIAVLDARRGLALREAVERLSLQVERMPLGHMVRDLERRVLQWNPAAERIFGWTAAEALGRRDDELLTPPDERARVAADWSALMGGRRAAPSIRSHVRRDGQRIRCEWHDALLRDGEGRLLGVLSMVADVTERVELERQLAAAQRMEAVGTLAGGVAHDFNNLLTGIAGFSRLLRDRLAGDPEAADDLDQILLAADRAAGLTRHLLAFARRQPIDPTDLDLNRVVSDLLKLLQRVIGEHIEIRPDLAADLPMVRADASKVEQLLMNLCVNARDAMPNGGRLVITTAAVEVPAGAAGRLGLPRPGRYVRLAIADTGGGIDEALRERVFEPFFTTKAKGGGSGLGLAVSHGIVKQHGGAIDFVSRPGAGTTFEVLLPAAEVRPLERPRPGREAPVRGGTETLLLADDEPLVRMLAERALTALGYRVRLASDGAEAVSVFRQDPEAFAIAILDVVMPRLRGPRALEEMRALRPGLPVLFLSGYAEDDVFERSAGSAFLAKPFGPVELARRVREILDARAPPGP